MATFCVLACIKLHILCVTETALRRSSHIKVTYHAREGAAMRGHSEKTIT